ncbi:DUF3006 domain-containing protein [Bacillus alkalicellulosilyticus]|uniref:DUF3006 domain-containing protein n=1 Tax=Alkalihalobacterium alkalicellulosilyticum TaxID=1912214 RepID=UPI0009982003|nr:DUF3006 domain-containing protein [Bacillus alkalicellulosilyticus]
MKKAILDRIVDKKIGVLLVGPTEEEYHLSLQELPTNVKEGMVFRVEIIENKVVVKERVENEEKEIKSRINNKMDKLRNNPKSNYKKL